MPDAVCSPRLEELAAQRQELTDYRDEVTASLTHRPKTTWRTRVTIAHDLGAAAAQLACLADGVDDEQLPADGPSH